MSPLDHLSFAWQVWGYGLLGAILFMAILFVIAEWSAIVALFADLFTDAPIEADDAFVTPPPSRADADALILAARNGVTLVPPCRKVGR